jgi:arylsulfatase A-like enzyme
LRSGLTRVLIPREHFGIPDSEITLGEALRQRGYRTACIGKWHLGDRPQYRPNRHGFDYFYGLLYSNDMTLPVLGWPPIKLFRNGDVIESPVKQSTLTRRLRNEALEFIEANKSNPFLLYLAHTMPHLPCSTSPEFAGQSRQGCYGDAVQEIDEAMGEILGALARHGLEDNTLVVFSSDNGPAVAIQGPGGSTGGLRGGKGSTWEGGVRVPCVVRWPQHIPGGSVLPGVSCLMDLFATAVALAGVQLPSGYAVDGLNLMPFLEGRSGSPRSRYCYYHADRLFAVRLENWKAHFWKAAAGKKGRYTTAVRCEPPELYDLKEDAAESRDLSGKQPEVVARLTRLAGEVNGSIVAGRLPPPHWRSLLP